MLTTGELPLHGGAEAKARRMARLNHPCRPAQDPRNTECEKKPQTAGKATAVQRASLVYQMLPPTHQAGQGPLRAVRREDPRIQGQETVGGQTGQAYRGLAQSDSRGEWGLADAERSFMPSTRVSSGKLTDPCVLRPRGQVPLHVQSLHSTRQST